MKNTIKQFVLNPTRNFIFILLNLIFIYGYSQNTIKIAVRAHSGVEEAANKWNETANYLSSKVEGYTFQMIPFVTFEEMRYAVANKKVDFVLTNPTAYIDLSLKYGISSILTLNNNRENVGYTEFGSVIFTRADRTDINLLRDIEGKSIMGVHNEAFGGWQMAYRELLNNKIDPFIDCSKVLFSPNGTQEEVVFEVVAGNVDVGTVRTGILEKLDKTGEINIKNVKVLEPAPDSFPLIHTGILYPEWAFAKLSSTDEILSQNVAIALIKMDIENPAAIKGNYIGWKLPKNYNQVMELLKTLRVAPFEDYGKVSLLSFLKRYWAWFFFTIIVIIGLSSLIIYITGINKKLDHAKKNLEWKVDERTAELNKINLNLKNEIEQRKLADENLKISEERWQFALQGNGDGVWDWNAQTNKVFFSKRWKEMLGYQEDEISDDFSEWEKLVHPDEKERNYKILNALLNSETETLLLEHRLKCKDGSYKWILSRGKVISRTEDNKPKRIIGTHIDLTLRKQAEYALMQEKEFSEKIIDTGAALIVGLDQNHSIQIFNKGAEKITGYSKEEVVGKDWFKLFFPNELFDNMNKVWKDAWGTPAHSYENPIRIKSGEERIISWQSTGIYESDDTSKHLLISIGEDITERKNAETELKRSEYVLNETQRIAKLGGWIYDVETKQTYFSEEVFNIYEIDDKKMFAAEEGIKFYHPEDYKLVQDSFLNAITNGESYDIEVRFISVRGKNKWVRTAGKPILKNGKVVTIIGNIMDISESKKAEEELKKHREHLEELVKERTLELEEKNEMLKRTNQAFIGRELRMVELKKKIEDLKKVIDALKGKEQMKQIRHNP